MTVAELITALSALPQDARVLVTAYECGYDELIPDCVELAPVTFDRSDRGYNGDWRFLEKKYVTPSSTRAVLLSRTSS